MTNGGNSETYRPVLQQKYAKVDYKLGFIENDFHLLLGVLKW